MEQINKKIMVIMCVIVVLMTALGYVSGILSHNVIIYKEAQRECYEWLQKECPCIFEPILLPQYANLTMNLTGGQNVLEEKS